MITLIGPATGYLGIGSTLRQFARALIAAGESIAIVDTDPGLGRSGHDLSLERYFTDRPGADADSINIWVIGATSIPTRALELCGQPLLQRAFNVAFVWWELTAIPDLWVKSIEAFDAIVTGSEFVQAAFANAQGAVPVLMARQPIEVPAGVVADRKRFGINEGAFVVYTGFDIHSDYARKNPVATVDAFKMAFQNEKNVQLVIKVSSANVTGEPLARLKDLRVLSGADDRIVLIDERLNIDELFVLYACCDVAISLHRSEGLALMPLEMMRLGRAVVATGWSGNMTYMSHSSAGLVKYSLVAIDESSLIYSPRALGITAKWAEPDIEDAAFWLATFANDPELRNGYSAAAMEASCKYDFQARKLQFVDEIRWMARTRRPRAEYQVDALKKEIELLQWREYSRRQAVEQTAMGKLLSACVKSYERHVGWRFNRSGKAC